MADIQPIQRSNWFWRPQRLRTKIFNTCVVVMLSYVLSMIMMQPFSFSTSMFVQSGGSGNDYTISDFYNLLADSRAVRVLDPDVVIVDIEDFSREEIACMIDTLNTGHPAVVGIDVTFIRPRATDEHLILAVNNIKCPVMAATVKSGVFGRDTFNIDDQSYFTDLVPHAIPAIVTVPTRTLHGVVREFGIDFVVNDTITGETTHLPSFAKAVAGAYRPETLSALDRRNTVTEYINYPSREFRKLSFSRLAADPSIVKDKIVLLGALTDPSDLHKTPVGMDVPGIELHAYAISTILNGNYLHRLNSFQNWLIAFVLCFLFIFLSFSIQIGYKGLVLRVVQLLLLYAIVRVGYYFFLKHDLVIDFSCSFLMITFGFFSCDIFYGVDSLWRDKISHFFKKKPQNTEK